MIEVDARGLSCPEPVLRTKNALTSSPSEVKVIVDNNVAKENVTKLLESNGYTVSVNEQEEDILVNGRK